MTGFRGRKDRTLGTNELRTYLEKKRETSKSDHVSKRVDEYVEYKPPKSNSKVLLVSLPITIPKYMQKRCIPPLGVSYVAASLEQNGIDTEIIDCCVEGWHIERYSGSMVTYGIPPEELRERLKESNPDIVGLSLLFSTDIDNLFETSLVVRECLPNATIVLGGLHPTIYPEEMFELDLSSNGMRTIDFVIRGEGEKRLVEFTRDLEKGLVNLNADGLVGFVGSRFILNDQTETIQDLDSLPFPAYHLLPMEKYFEINVPFSPVPQGKRVVPMLTTRGCPIGCSFCANTNTWWSHRKRSVENITAEVRHLKNTFQVDEIQFADDNLTFDMNHALEKFAAIKDYDLLWCTPNGTMVNKLTEELISVMAESGMYQITLSLDSAVARTLKELHHKPVNLNSIPGLISKCRELGVFTHGTLVVGMPGETLEEIAEGFDYVKTELHFTSVSAFIAAAIPGSELYHEMLDAGKITKKDARQIDTTKAKITLSNIDPLALEEMIESFQSEYLEISRDRDPDEYLRKYSKLIETGRWDEAQCGGKLT